MNKKYIYTLRVKAWFLYKVEADNEKEAREILEKNEFIQSDGDIDGRLITENYKDAWVVSSEKNRESK